MVSAVVGDGYCATEPFCHGNFSLERVVVDELAVEQLDDVVDETPAVDDEVVGRYSTEGWGGHEGEFMIYNLLGYSWPCGQRRGWPGGDGWD